VTLRLAVSVEHRLVTDRQTDRQTHDDGTALAWRPAVIKRTDLVNDGMPQIACLHRKQLVNVNDEPSMDLWIPYSYMVLKARAYLAFGHNLARI